MYYGNNSSYFQAMRWRLDNLVADTPYECLVQARNRYGWSQASKMFTFMTLSLTYKSKCSLLSLVYCVNFNSLVSSIE